MNKQIIKLCMLGTILLSSSQLFCKAPKNDQDDSYPSDDHDDTTYIYQENDNHLPDHQSNIINQICERKSIAVYETDRMHVTDAILSIPEENLIPEFTDVVCLITQVMNGETTRFVIEDISKMPELFNDIFSVFDQTTMENLNEFAEPNDIASLIRDLPFMKQDMWQIEIDRLIHIGRKKNS